jgi:hypothetical protein
MSPNRPDDVIADIDAPGFWDNLGEVNPAFGFRVDRSAIERLVENMSPEDVKREVFGIWDKTNETLAVVSRDDWKNLSAVPDNLGAPASFGINATRSGWFWIDACWRDGDSAHVEIAMGTQSEVEAMNFLTKNITRRTLVKHDSTGAAKAVGEKLKQLGYAASAYTQNEVGAGNALWLGMAEGGRLSHGGQQELSDAIRGSRRQDRANGGWFLMPRSESFDIGPALAMSAAIYAAMTSRQPTGTGRSGTSGRVASTGRRAGVM